MNLGRLQALNSVLRVVLITDIATTVITSRTRTVTGSILTDDPHRAKNPNKSFL